MNEDIRAMLDGIVVQARKNLEMSGRLLPVAFIFGPSKTVHIVGCPWADVKEKEEMVASLQAFCREKQAIGIAIIGEAWFAKLPDGEWDGTPAKDLPGSKEAFYVYVETLDGYWMANTDIIRDSKGKPTFGEVKFEPITHEREPMERFQKFLA